MKDKLHQKAFRMAGAAWKPLAGIAVLIALIMWTTGVFKEKTEPAVLNYQPGFELPADAESFTVQSAPAQRRIDVMGTVRSEETVRINARLKAHVNEVFVNAGDIVAMGDPLLTLDDRDLREQLASAEAGYHRAKREHERTQLLFKQDAATDQAMVSAEQQYKSALAQLKQAGIMLTYSQLNSPMDGVVIDRFIDEGELANPGRVLVSIYNPARMRLETPVPVRLMDLLHLHTEVTVELEHPERIYTGRVTEIVGEIDPSSRTQHVKIQLEDAERVRPGTFGRLILKTGPREGIYIPLSAVYRAGQLEMVQVVYNGRVLQRLVKTGREENGQVEILSGLEHGEIILINPVMEG